MSDEPDIKPEKKRRRRRRLGIWMVLGIVFLTGLMFLAGLSVTGRSLVAPQWLTAEVVKRVNAGLPSGKVSLDRMRLSVDRAGVPHIQMENVGIYDDRGVEVARLNDVGARFALRAALRAQIRPEVVRLVGAQMTLRRRVDGQFDISFGAGAAASGTLTGVLDAMDDVFAQQALENIELVDAQEMTITLEDARSGRLWQITDGALQIRRGSQGLDVTVDFEVFNGTEELAEVILGIRTDASSSSAAIGVTFKNAAAPDIALQSPVLSFLGVLNAPISGAVRTEFDGEGALSSLAGTLQIAAGALQPTPGIEPLEFTAAKAYFEFDPAEQKLVFSEVNLTSEIATITARGQAYLREYQNGWPSTFLGQFALSDIRVHPRELYEEAIEFSEGAADIRVRLEPFSIDVGQFVLMQGEEKLQARGRVLAGDAGWEVSSDLRLNQIRNDRLLALWPVSMVPKTREWLLKNIRSALLSDVKGAIRVKPGQEPRLSVGWDFEDTTVRYIRTQPVIEDARGYAMIDGKTFTLMVEEGTVSAPLGGKIAMAGSSFQIADLTVKPAQAKVRLNGQATTTAVLSLLDAPPFRVLRRTDFGPDVAEGQARFEASIDFALKQKILMEDVVYSATGVLEKVKSHKLVPGRVLTADRLSLRADNSVVEIGGPVKIGAVEADVLWRQELGPENVGRSNVSGDIELSQRFVEEFSIGLPEGSVSGRGLGRFDLDLVAGEAPKFTLVSDLNRLGLRISQIGWAKPRNATGKLTVEGQLGEHPRVDAMELKAAGLNATGGSVTLREDGGLDRLAFNWVQVGGWLEAPVTLRGRGPGRATLVEVTGGTLDIRKTAFGGGSGVSSSSGAGGPIVLAMDRVIISEGMMLTGFEGNFDSSGGFSGTFKARMNGKTGLSGSLSPGPNGTVIKIVSSNAGGVLRSAGIVEYANRGKMDLTLRPLKQNGTYAGNLKIKNTKVLNAPGLTDLLSAISIVGLLDQLSGEGISFDDVKARFRLTPKVVVLEESSAVGPSLGISLDGTYDLTSGQMNMQGVISPVFFLNGIGQLVSRRGEGLFGFTFKLRGTNEAPKVKVNPLSILTPGAFREIFRTPPPKGTE